MALLEGVKLSECLKIQKHGRVSCWAEALGFLGKI